MEDQEGMLTQKKHCLVEGGGGGIGADYLGFVERGKRKGGSEPGRKEVGACSGAGKMGRQGGKTRSQGRGWRDEAE